MAFSDKFKKTRDDLGLTQKDIAGKLNLSRSAIAMYERGEREPDFKTLASIISLFDVSADYLLDFSGSKNIPESFQTPEETDKNIVRITSRAGDVTVREMSDEQIDIIKRMVDQMPEVAATTQKFSPLPATIAAYGGGVKKSGRRKKDTHT